MTNDFEANLWKLLARVEKVIRWERPALWAACIVEIVEKFKKGEEV